jgi:NADPH:quinone reductase-like Zn-dependent oxidoreductase
MRALRFDRFGDPQVLQVSKIADPVAGDGQAVVAVQAAMTTTSRTQLALPP